jgi:hypothetical protein
MGCKEFFWGYGGFHCHGATPIAGWFYNGKSIYKWMIEWDVHDINDGILEYIFWDKLVYRDIHYTLYK